MSTEFSKLAELCEKLEKISERIPKINLIANFLRNLERDEISPAVRMIIGKVFPDWSDETLDVSWGTIIKVLRSITGATPKEMLQIFNKVGDPGELAKILFETKKVKRQLSLFETKLTIREVFRTIVSLAKIKGEGSRSRKEAIVKALLSKASPLEAKYIVKVILGEMRHGVSEGLMEEAIAKAIGAQTELVERANMLLGDIGEVAEIALTRGIEGLKEVKLRLFHPIKPMLAQKVDSVADALKEHGGISAFEYKLDGVRMQIHKQEDKVRIFSRRLTDITDSFPEIVKEIRDKLKANEAIVEGETIAIGDDGRPLPFQYLVRRLRRVKEKEKMAKKISVKLFLFDCLYRDGKLLLDEPYTERWKNLEEIANGIPLVPRMITNNVKEAEEFFNKARKEGHEGLMAKKLDSKYTPGIRGKKWLKIKGILETLDLVIVAADWGYGRRKDWLSDYYLAARDEKTGEFLIVGKTFKGLTDTEFEALTKRLLELKLFERGRTVFVKPEIVVEVAFDEIQKSPKYKSGYALRFARITRIRYDKSPEEADTIQKIEELYKKQFSVKAKPKV